MRGFLSWSRVRVVLVLGASAFLLFALMSVAVGNDGWIAAQRGGIAALVTLVVVGGWVKFIHVQLPPGAESEESNRGNVLDLRIPPDDDVLEAMKMSVANQRSDRGGSDGGESEFVPLRVPRLASIRHEENSKE